MKPFLFTGIRSFTWDKNKKYNDWRPDCEIHGMEHGLKMYIELKNYNTDTHEAHFLVICSQCWAKYGTTIQYQTWYAKRLWWYEFCQELKMEIQLDDPGGIN